MAKRYYCEGCGYGWISKKPFGDPAYCPRCKSEDIEENSEYDPDEEDQADLSALMPTGQKVATFRNIFKSNKDDLKDVYEVLYDILKDKTQEEDKATIKKDKPFKVIVHLEKKFTRGEMEFVYDLKVLKNKIILSLKAEIRGWGRYWYPFQLENLEKEFGKLVGEINQILE